MKETKNSWELAFFYWLPLGFTIFIFAGLVYAAVQQNYRQSANDPQIQIAEDVSAAITSGKATPDQIVSAQPTQEMASTLSTFVAVYSATGTPIGSSVAIDGKMPTPPAGVFDYVKQHGSERFTWEPKSGLRVAAVVQPFSGQESGYVLAGRSLNEIETRIQNMEKMSVLAGLLAWVVTYLLVVFLLKMVMAKPNNPESAEASSLPAETVKQP